MVLLCFQTFPIFAQATDGVVGGKIIDETGAAVAGASVKVVNEATGFRSQTVSDSQGLFRINYVPVGGYVVTAEASNFKKTEVTSVVVALNQVVDMTIRLQVGRLDESPIIVSAGDVLVETSTSTLSNVYGSRKVVELPSLKNSQLELALLSPNVTAQPGGALGEGGSVGGNRPSSNAFGLDGVENTDAFLRGHVIDVIPEAVAEFTLLTNQYSAEFGNAAAGQFNTVTKSGSNEFHGGISFNNTNRHFNAVDHLTKEAIARGQFVDERPRLDFNRVAGYLGGPVVKNKLFFFGAYQYDTGGSAGGAGTFLAPTAQGLAVLNSVKEVSPVTFGILKRFVPPALAASRTVTAFGQAVPVGPVNFRVPEFTANNTFNVNIDQTLDNNDQIRYRYNFAKNNRAVPGLGNQAFTGVSGTLNQLASVVHIHNFTPSVAVETRFSYRRKSGRFNLPDEFNSFPTILNDELGVVLGPGNVFSEGETTNNYQIVNNVTWLKGRHGFKFGVDYRKVDSSFLLLPQRRGLYDYATLEQFLRDLKPRGLNGAVKGVGSPTFGADRQFVSGFAQDDIKVTPNLTLNVGLRYEFATLFESEQAQSLNAIATVPGVIEFREPKTDKNNLGPRVGLAWGPDFESGIGHVLFGRTGDGSVRAGFTVSFDDTFGALVAPLVPPQFQQLLNAAAGDGGPFGTATNFLQNGGLGSAPILPATPAAARLATSTFGRDRVMPYSMSWSLSYQRRLLGDLGLELRYLGTRGVKQATQVLLNGGVPPFAAAGFSLPTYLSASQVPDAKTRDTMHTLDELVARSFLGTRIGGLGVPGFQPGIVSIQPIGSATYHAGSMELTKRFSQGYFLSAVYTFSKNLDHGTNVINTSTLNPRRAQNGLDIGDMRGPSALDAPHRLTVSGLWELPRLREVGNGFIRTVFGGFQLNAIYTFQSGQPFTPLSGADSNLNLDTAGDRTVLNPNGKPGTGSPVVPVLNSKNQVVGYLAVNGNAQYIQAGRGVIATAGANTLRSPRINNLDFSLFKDFELNERVKLQFRTELFNAFNHEQLLVGGGSVFFSTTGSLNLAYPNVGSPLFNNPRVFAGRPRVIQFGLKIIF